MPKRKSGWYRVWFSGCERPTLMMWDDKNKYFQDGPDCYREYDDELQKYDPKMVMTPEGEVVYHKQG